MILYLSIAWYWIFDIENVLEYFVFEEMNNVLQIYRSVYRCWLFEEFFDGLLDFGAAK